MRCWRSSAVVGLDVEADRTAAAPHCFGKDRLDQPAAEAAAAAFRAYAERQDFNFAGEIACQDKPDRVLVIPGDQPETARQTQDALERRRVPRVFGKAGGVQLRERLGRS